MKEHRPFRGLLRRRQCLVPTWRGWLLLLCALVVAGIVAVREAHPFLAVTDPVAGEVLVAEGWMPDYSFRQAIEEFRRNRYRALYVTGGPLERGEPLSEFKTYAELGAAVIERFGLPTNAVQAVPAPRVRQDRTFASAIALKRWFQDRGSIPAKINVVTTGAHARRTRLLFEKAFRKTAAIGIISVEDERYDPKHWWRTSYGFRDVVNETVAYVYARFLFRARSD
jgi:hypothetical protein